MYLACPVISQDHVIEVPCSYLNESSSLYAHTQPILVATDFVVVEINLVAIDIVVWVFHMILQVHMIEKLCHFKGETPSW